ncbi:MAG: sulfatase-like hydrolase/transferase [Clostridiales bacterium]|nr:sulfatase-like hydrolase/transferase [Clostridiales bacterium]
MKQWLTKWITPILAKGFFPLLFCLLVGMDVGFRLLYVPVEAFDFSYTRSLLFTMCWAALMCAVVALLPTLVRRIMTVALCAFWCFLFLVHGAMYNIFGSFFSFADLAYAEDGAAFLSLSYLHWRKGLIIMIVLALCAAVLLAICIPKKRWHWRRLVIGGAVLVLSILGLIAVGSTIQEVDEEGFYWDTSYSSSDDASVYANFTNTVRCMELAGSYQYLFRSFIVSYGIEDWLTNSETYEQLDEYYSQQEDHEGNDMTGAFEGKNVILILLESIDTWLLTEDYMPNLYALQQESINCVNHYSPMFISAATFGSEFTVNTGLLAPTNGVNSKAYSIYSFPYSLANLFSAAEYAANSFHSSNPTIYNRGEIHVNWGYLAYHNYEDMGMDDYQLDSQMIRGYSQMVSDDAFFSFILTYSGHGPYTEEMDNISSSHMEDAYAAVDLSQLPEDISDEDLQEYYYAVAHAMETDAFIGELVEALTEDGHIEDTVLIFFSDHYAKYMSNTELVMELKGAENTDFLCQTPFFIYSADMEPQTVTKLTSTMDIAPTIANLFDLDTEYIYYSGNDIFSDEGDYVIFKNYAWYDGKIYYSSEEGGGVDLSGDDGTLAAYIAQMNETVQTTVNMSWDTLKSNYFAYLERKGS